MQSAVLSKRSAFVSVMALLFSLAAVYIAAPARAAQIDVTTTADEDGTESESTGCSLREAIISANTDTAVGGCEAGDPGADTIVLDSETYVLDLNGTLEDDAVEGDLDILDDLTITGNGPEDTVVDANQIDRVFHIPPPAATTVDFQDLTITGGSEESGGGLRIDDDEAIVSLTNVVVTQNSAGDGLCVDCAALGGGIANFADDATLTLTNSRVVDNSATVGICGGCAGLGGGIYNGGGADVTVTLDDSDITGNVAGADICGGCGGAGGGLYNDGMDFSFRASGGGGVFTNRADVFCGGGSCEALGGGIYNGVEADRSSFSFDGSTVANNGTYAEETASSTSSSEGGGIYNDAVSVDVLFEGGSFLEGNSASIEGCCEAEGGGIYNGGAEVSDGELSTYRFDNSTVQGNSAGDDGGAVWNSGPEAGLFFSNTDILRNGAVDGSGGAIWNGGTRVSMSFDGGTVARNQAEGDGGAVHNASDGSLTTMEFEGVTLGGPLPADGNTASEDGGAISNDASRVTLAADETLLANNGAVSEGGAFSNDGERLTGTFTNSTLSHNSADARGGALWIHGDETSVLLHRTDVTDNTSDQSGGGIAVDCCEDRLNLTLRNSTVTGNIANANGGGILYRSKGGTLRLVDSTVSDNTALDDGGGIDRQEGLLVVTGGEISGNIASATAGGGGILVHSSGDGVGPMRLTDVLIADNRAVEGSGGGILNRGPARLDGVTLRDNVAARGGGGIRNTNGNPLTIVNSTITGNRSNSTFGQGGGGGIYNECCDNTLRVVNTVISENSALTDGGGIYNVGECGNTVKIFNSTIRDNTAQDDGGGIYHDDCDGTLMRLSETTVSGNHAGVTGGGIHVASGSTLALVNATLSGNTAGADGGGLGSLGSGLAILRNTTVTENNATGFGDGLSAGGGGTFELKNTIVAGNASGAFGSDCSTFSGSIDSLGHNLDGDDSCGLDPVNGDIPAGDADLGPLTDNGGPTQGAADEQPTLTHLPGGDSDATDAAFNGACPDFDQRLFDRPGGAAFPADVCDMGAVEAEAAGGGGGTITVDDATDAPDATAGTGPCDAPGADTCTLRAAVQTANVAAGPETIEFDVTGCCTLTISGSDDTAAAGDLDITEDLSIRGDGSAITVIDADTGAEGPPEIGDRVFDIRNDDVSVHIAGVTITDGNAVSDDGGAIQLNSDGQSLRVVDSVLTDNETSRDAACDPTVTPFFCNAGRGGAIYVGFADNNVTLRNTTVSMNATGSDVSCSEGPPEFFTCTLTGNDGGGIYFDSDRGTLTVTNDSKVIDNSTAGGECPSEADACTFNGGDGGGLYVGGSNGDDAHIRLTDSLVAANITFEQTWNDGGDGGGIYSNAPDQDIIFNNTVLGDDPDTEANEGGNAADNGGGLYVSGENGGARAEVSLADSDVKANSAGQGDGGFTGNGGGIWFGSDFGSLTLTNTDVTNNGEPPGSGNTSQGGGIYIGGAELTAVTLRADSDVIGNQAQDLGGGIYQGGAIPNGPAGGVLSLSGGSDVIGNTVTGFDIVSVETISGDGAGIWFDQTLELNGVSISGNLADNNGGGIYAEEDANLHAANSIIGGELPLGQSGVNEDDDGAVDEDPIDGEDNDDDGSTDEDPPNGNVALNSGGGMWTDINTHTTLEATDVTANNSEGISLAPGTGGGGIWNWGTLRVVGGAVSSNFAFGEGGGIYNLNGFVRLDGMLLGDDPATETVDEGNTAEQDGGGLFNNGGTVRIQDTEIAGNNADSDGGGIWSISASTLLVFDSAITENQAGDTDDNTLGRGGGLWLSDEAMLRNVTVSGNVALNGSGGGESLGGGIWNDQDLTLKNVTVTDNTAEEGGGIFDVLNSVHSTNSIIADNTPVDCDVDTFVSGGHNIDGDDSCGLDGPGDQPGVADPDLEALDDNGGPTRTHALESGSEAIDTGSNGHCLPTDQRSFDRWVGAACDVGAFESGAVPDDQPPPPQQPGGGGGVFFTLTVTKTGTGSGTVTSSPAGINCGSDCTESYVSGTAVTLTQSADSGSTFAGWSGACSGTGACVVTMDASKTVTATFNTTASPGPGGTQCSDGVDNDGDGLIDLADPDCLSAEDTVEGGIHPACGTPDVVCGTPNADNICITLADNDTGDGSITVYLGAGDDTLAVPADLGLTVTVFAGDGNDTVFIGPCGSSSPSAARLQQGAQTVLIALGQKGNDTLIGGKAADTLRGGRGNDTIRGRGGKDVVRGGPNNDVLKGGNKADNVKGGPGKDNIRGGPAPDVLKGGKGNDTINGGPGADDCTGGPGTDTVVAC